ncbi:MAG: phosphotransferase [Rubripirellula sp.]
MKSLEKFVQTITGSQRVQLLDVIQSLWSGYGVIQRALLHGSQQSGSIDPLPVVIKHIDLSQVRENRRGWGSDLSHQRKIRSYQVEKSFYELLAARCEERCTVPRLIAAEETENASGWIIILSDLNSYGFDARKDHATLKDMHACLNWLANFHAEFLGIDHHNLWPTGTYWHLETRPDEYNAMPNGGLKRAATAIDQRLNNARFKTLVHGDAKLANFCFTDGQPTSVAAVDFQYVGGGCGIKDVAYFISSCLSDRDAERMQEQLLAFYFDQLQQAITARSAAVDFAELESEWRALYAYAWADFCRFLTGWSPGHWKLNSYTDAITERVLDELDERSSE